MDDSEFSDSEWNLFMDEKLAKQEEKLKELTSHVRRLTEIVHDLIDNVDKILTYQESKPKNNKN